MMTVLNVPEMHCENCVKRINKALSEAGLAFEVSLKDKTVTIKDEREGSVETAVSALDDLGFSAEKK